MSSNNDTHARNYKNRKVDAAQLDKRRVQANAFKDLLSLMKNDTRKERGHMKTILNQYHKKNYCVTPANLKYHL